MRSSWIVPVGPKCHHKCPYEREASGDLTHRGEGDVMTGRVWSDAATIQETLAATRSWKRQGMYFLLEFAHTLIAAH